MTYWGCECAGGAFDWRLLWPLTRLAIAIPSRSYDFSRRTRCGSPSVRTTSFAPRMVRSCSSLLAEGAAIIVAVSSLEIFKTWMLHLPEDRRE